MGKYYEVRRPGDRRFKLLAKDNTQDKRRYCKLFGLRANDAWTGSSVVSEK